MAVAASRQSAQLGRRRFLAAVGAAMTGSGLRGQTTRAPNVIVILADDLGFGDVGCFGATVPTPNLNQMADEGIRLTKFYSASPVCSPSRAALLTGRYPARSGVVNVLMPDTESGLRGAVERTLPKILKEQGYRTAIVGKWHLGTSAACTPAANGFDEHYGLPYSNDMQPLPMLRNGQVIGSSARQEALTEQFTAEAVEFIGRNKENPFFLYLAHTGPHIPLVPSRRFRAKSGHGPYGDVVAELDWSTGQVLEALKTNGIDENTLVIFTSDNGPWYQGSAGNLQGRKGSTYEGGVRVPFLARFPGRIPKGLTSGGIGSMMDLLPTIATLAGAQVPAGSVDGVDIWPMLSGERPHMEREALLFFDSWHVQCVRWGPWKLHLSRYNSVAWTLDPPGGRANLPLPAPELYHIDEDPAESRDRAPEQPELVAELRDRVERLLLGMPETVRSMWEDTKRQRVQPTPVGSLPRKEQ